MCIFLKVYKVDGKFLESSSTLKEILMYVLMWKEKRAKVLEYMGVWDKDEVWREMRVGVDNAWVKMCIYDVNAEN